MKIVCIDKYKWTCLTIGKIYFAMKRYSYKYYSIQDKGPMIPPGDIEVEYYEIINDDKVITGYPIRLFKLLEEARQEKLEQLGI